MTVTVFHADIRESTTGNLVCWLLSTSSHVRGCSKDLPLSLFVQQVPESYKAEVVGSAAEVSCHMVMTEHSRDTGACLLRLMPLAA